MGANVLYSDATTNHVSLILITIYRIRDYCFFNSQIRDEQNTSFLSRIIELENHVSLIRKFVMNRITPFYLEL